MTLKIFPALPIASGSLRKALGLSLLICICLLAPAPGALAASYYVSGTGRDGHDGFRGKVDLSLASGSPGLDSGEAGAAPIIDYAGKRRPVGEKADRGAYQY
ncbi:MAG TPA: choice-of-anchor Q domain-containing protein [Acidisarcina sp.]